MNCEKERYQINVLKILLILLCLVTLYFSFVYFFPSFFDIMGKVVGALSPFITAVVAAVLIDPIVDWLELKKGFKRGTAVAISLLIMLAIIVALVLLVASRLVIELTELYQRLPAYTEEFSRQGLNLAQEIRNFMTNNPLPVQAQDALQQNLQSGLQKLSSLVAGATDKLFKLLTGLPAFITVLFVAGLATFFVSRDKVLITSNIYRFLPRKMIRPSSTVVGEVSKALVGYFRAQVILLTITTILTVVGINFLGLEYGLTIGITVGILDLLPVIGPGALLVPWALILILGKEVRLGVGLLMLYGIISGTRQLLEPKILSGNIGLHPLVTIVSLYLGLRLLGFWGIIIGPFLVIIGKAVLRQRV